MLEVNPRASRTVPFVSKATGMPLAKVAAKVMVGVSLARQGYIREPIPAHVSVKEAVFPFAKFAGVDIVLGPEMRSTGEVMGVSERFSIAFAKSQLAAGSVLPEHGKVFISVADRAKRYIVGLAARLEQLGFELLATKGTGSLLEQAGIKVQSSRSSRATPTCWTSWSTSGTCNWSSTPPAARGPHRRGPHPRGRRVARHPLHHDDPGRRRVVRAIEAMREVEVEAVQDRFPFARRRRLLIEAQKESG